MATLRLNNKAPIEKMLQQDELIKPGKKYAIADQRIFNDPSNDAHSTSSRQTQLPVSQLSFPRPTTVDATPTEITAVSTASITSRNFTPPRQPPAFTSSASSRQPAPTRSQSASPSRIAHSLSTLAFNESPRPSSSNPNDLVYQRPTLPRIATPSRRQLIAQFYVTHESTRETAFATYAPRQPIIFLNSNLFEFFNQRPLIKAAVFILLSKADNGLNDAAHHTICQCLNDLIKEDRPTFDVSLAELEALPTLINELTSTNLFFNLTMKNHQGILDRSIYRQRGQHPPKSPKLKLTATDNMDETIDGASSS